MPKPHPKHQPCLPSSQVVWGKKFGVTKILSFYVSNGENSHYSVCSSMCVYACVCMSECVRAHMCMSACVCRPEATGECFHSFLSALFTEIGSLSC